LKIKLSKHQASALRADIGEINQMESLKQARLFAHSRYRDVIIRDAGGDPAKLSTITIEDDEASGETFLSLTFATTAGPQG
jgi:Tfp pilus assembly protein PilN